MGEQRQSEGRQENAASPVEDWEAKGVLEKKQREDIERTGRTGQAAGEDKSFREGGGIPNPDDLTGPAGDPAEGPRDTSPS